jgi:4-hydroxy-4-methyl-2-oxoglutarate aldolase
MELDFNFLKNVSTSLVSDVLDRLGIDGQCESIRPISPDMQVFGRAYTVRIRPQSDPPLPHDEYQDDLQPGEVCVLDSQGFLGGGSWGDLRTLRAQQKGVAGVVIDGAVRDTANCLESRFPVFARGSTMRTGGGKLRIEAKQVPVTLDGVTVNPGDIIIADADGVAVIPCNREAEAVPLLREFVKADTKIMAALKDGVSLKEARRRYAYNPPITDKSVKQENQ